MTHWFDVFRFELRRQFSSKAYLLVTFVAPLLVAGGFYAYRFYQEQTEDQTDEPATIITDAGSKVFGYVDRTPEQLFPSPDSYTVSPESCALRGGQELTPALIKRVTSPGCFQNIRAFTSFGEGKQVLEDDRIDSLWVIEPDYVRTGKVSIYTEAIGGEGGGASSFFNDYLLASLLYSVEPDAYELMYLRLRDPAVVTEYRLDTGGEGKTAADEGQSFGLVYVFGLVLMMTVFWGGGYLMQSVVREKESRIIEILLSSVRPTPLLVGKILAMGLCSLLQVGMLTGTILVIGGQINSVIDSADNVDLGAGTLALMLVYFGLGYLLFGSLMAVIGAMSTSLRESQNLTTLVTLPAVVPFFFISLFAEEPNSGLPTALSMIPLTSPMSMVMRLSVTDVPLWELALSLGVLGATIAGALWLAGRMFGVDTLLSLESALKLRDLPKVLRG